MKVLFISHVDWDWIKQRPHFLAEEMAAKCQLTYVYKRIMGKKKTSRNQRSNKMNYRVVSQLPFSRFRIIRKLNWIIYQLAVGRIMGAEQPDVIWTSDCHDVSLFRYGKKTVYEVMDLYGEMSTNLELKKEIFANERIMLKKANHVVVTSSYIRQYLKNMYGIKDDKISLIRNGVSMKQEMVNKAGIEKPIGEKAKLAYIGTVANWFDWEIVMHSLEEMPEIEYHIIGPLSDKPSIELPEDRVKFYGPVKHEQLADLTQHMDILIMPFLVNKVVKAVDPVKLYEYVTFAKDIICVKYPEVERFADYVYFYNSKEEYVDSIRKICAERTIKYTMDQATDFLQHNNWEERANAAIQICEDVIKANRTRQIM